MSPEELEEVDALARQAGLDRSAMTKSLVRRGLRELCLDQAIEAYASDRVTLSRAAEIAKIPVSDFILQMDRRSLTLHYDLEDLEEDLIHGR
jgi:predicted HTH domain antitoxin